MTIVGMEPESRPKGREGVLTQRAAESVVLLDSRSGEYFSLDEVGARIWELADGSRTVAEIARTLAGEFDAPATTIEADVLALLEELAGASLVADDGRA